MTITLVAFFWRG